MMADETMILAMETVITQLGTRKAAEFMAAQSDAVEGLTRNNGAFAEAYRKMLEGAPTVERLTHVNDGLRAHIKQLEEMLGDDVRICQSCKDGGNSPEDYVHEAKHGASVEDYGWCCETCIEGMQDAD
jgi:hypothetical protein